MYFVPEQQKIAAVWKSSAQCCNTTRVLQASDLRKRQVLEFWAGPGYINKTLQAHTEG